MNRLKPYILYSCLCVFLFALAIPAYAQQYSLKGRVIDGSTKKNAGFAIVIIKEAGIVVNAAGGNYYTELPQAGTYTVQVQSRGLQTITTTITVNSNVSRDFTLNPYASKGKGVVIKGERVIQKISRRTMKVDEIKEVPASFGDSVNALTSLPGVIRSAPGGFFGPLVIRGSDPIYNRYYIDGMPIDNPLHFGGVHSVIANDLMSEIDLYASSYTSDFGGPLAAVININTIDEVDEFGGWSDVGLISAAALIKRPVTKKVIDEKGEVKDENSGYLIVSGRVGYLSLLIPPIYELISNEKLDILPEYWDYQVKAKYFLDSRNSVTVLCLGSIDYWRVVIDDEDVKQEEGADPFFSDINMKYDQQFHNQGFYYTFDNVKIKNTMMVYSSWSYTHMYFDSASLPAGHWLKGITIDTVPWILGAKDNFKWEWISGLAELRGGIESTWYHFDAKGDSLRLNPGVTDPMDPGAFDVIPFDLNFTSLVMGGYVEQRFTPGGFVFMPSFRSEWLRGTGSVTADPRGMMSYRFESDTTVSIAGGHYSAFFQANPYVFQQDPTYASQGDSLKPEKAWHSVLGIEQALTGFTANMEVFYNYFYDLVEQYEHIEDGVTVPGINSGKMRAYGIELLLKREGGEGDGFFGWGSYAFTNAERKSGLPVTFDPTGDRWIHSGYEQNHSLKIVSGYRKGKHTFSGKFQLYSSFPYTPITGSLPPVNGRYAPEYDIDHPNSKHLPFDHQLDLRYTHRTGYEWGYVSWYVEVINVYGQWYHSKAYKWRYDRPYSEDNPKVTADEGGLTLLPNFGVEVKF
ncbi:MAG TPA: TonB-dependent receptor plug domain-containing protein [Spirochaetota bacterium]|nr:TonB-dependent receptor plug domain-containing protein [Spirochaetota bacterium]